MIELIEKALRGELGEDQRRIAETGLEWIEVLIRKNTDYGSSVWDVPQLSPTTPPAAAILVRMSDKVSRLANLGRNPTALVNESFEDTMRDLGAYCLLYLARPKDERAERTTSDLS